MKRKEQNYLDFIPVKNPEIPWKEENGTVVLDIVHRGPAAKIAQIAFNRPRVSHISMEKFGSFIWKQIDGTNTIYEIGQKVKENFGEEAEPLYERLAVFFRTLQENKYIKFKR